MYRTPCQEDLLTFEDERGTMYRNIQPVDVEKRGMSALANHLRKRMRERGWNAAALATQADMPRNTLHNILQGGRPDPENIKKLAGALRDEPGLLTALAGYPVDPDTDPDGRYREIGRRISASPWLEERIDDLLRLSESEFRDLMKYLDFRRGQQG